MARLNGEPKRRKKATKMEQHIKITTLILMLNRGATIQEAAERAGYTKWQTARKALSRHYAERKNELADRNINTWLDKNNYLYQLALANHARTKNGKELTQAGNALDREAKALGYYLSDQVRKQELELKVEQVELIKSKLGKALTAAQLTEQQTKTFLSVLLDETEHSEAKLVEVKALGEGD